LSALGLENRERVDIVSERKGTSRRVENFQAIGYPIPRGCAAAYFPEANALVPLAEFADKSRTPASKSVIVRLEKVANR
jgi:anaerobic selenocysteine-containing dehydrogenase